MKVTKDMTIAEVLGIDRGTATIFMQHGMHCIGCPSASGESIADASVVHGIDVEALLADLNEFLSKNQ